MQTANLEIPHAAIEDFCRRWNLDEFSLFGSVLRDDFGPTSDIDVLIHFAPGGEMTLDSLVAMQQELSDLFGGREIDLVERQLIKNPFRRHEIRTHRQVLYAT